MTTWVKDDRGNKCSVEWFGTKEAAHSAPPAQAEAVNDDSLLRKLVEFVRAVTEMMDDSEDDGTDELKITRQHAVTVGAFIDEFADLPDDRSENYVFGPAAKVEQALFTSPPVTTQAGGWQSIDEDTPQDRPIIVCTDHGVVGEAQWEPHAGWYWAGHHSSDVGFAVERRRAQEGMMKYRPHRRYLDEAMSEVVEFDGTLARLIEIMRKGTEWMPEALRATTENVTVEPYGYDDRVKWNTHIVCINGAAEGFTDGPLATDERA